MTAAQLVTACSLRGVLLWREGDRLGYEIPPDLAANRVAVERILSTLRRGKPQLLPLLPDAPPAPLPKHNLMDRRKPHGQAAKERPESGESAPVSILRRPSPKIALPTPDPVLSARDRSVILCLLRGRQWMAPVLFALDRAGVEYPRVVKLSRGVTTDTPTLWLEKALERVAEHRDRSTYRGARNLWTRDADGIGILRSLVALGLWWQEKVWPVYDAAFPGPIAWSERRAETVADLKAIVASRPETFANRGCEPMPGRFVDPSASQSLENADTC